MVDKPLLHLRIIPTRPHRLLRAIVILLHEGQVLVALLLRIGSDYAVAYKPLMLGKW